MVTIELRVFETDKLVIEIRNGQPNTSVCLSVYAELSLGEHCYPIKCLCVRTHEICYRNLPKFQKFTKISKIYQNFKNLLKVIKIYQDALKFIENLPW